MTDDDMVLVQRIRFTGARTGLQSIPLKGIGRVDFDQIVEVTVEEADRYTRELQTRTGQASDFVKVGSEYAVERSEVGNRRMAQRDKSQPDAVVDEPLDDVASPPEPEPVSEDQDVVVEAETKKARTKKE